MRLHVVSLPHTQTTEDYLTCAYTQKIVRFGKMMRPLGHEVYIYGGEENTAECDEFIPLIKKTECDEWFGAHDANRFYPITWNPNDHHWRTMNARAVSAILDRRGSKEDLVLLIGGNCQEAIARGLDDMLSVEWGVGYEGIFAPFRAFESDTWRHYVYGKQGVINGVWYDATIPNFFDLDDFHPAPRGDYMLYVGRLVQRKGVEVAAQIAERTGRTLVIAGNGATHGEHGRVVAPEFTVEGDHIEYVGPVNRAERDSLMAGAAVTIVPTLYIEPFGGVAVESMLAGTPVLTTDWGAFVETVEPGVTGYRFHTLADGAEKVEQAAALDSAACRAYAQERYSLEAVGPQFDRWFKQVAGLWGTGWDA